MSWLADSFLADLEDIEGPSPVVVDQTELPTILTDSNFITFISSLVPSEEEQTYIKMIEKCSEWTPLIDSEITTLYRHVSNIFQKSFPELEQLVLDPLEYVRVVGRIITHPTISESTFTGLNLPRNVSVAITLSVSSGITSSVPSYLLDRAEELAKFRSKILDFMSEGSPNFFPNLNALLGPSLTARLVAAAGGLTNLAAMPSQNIESVGRTLVASGTGQTVKQSLIEQCDLIVHAANRRRALRLVLGKTSLAARVDKHGGGTKTTSYREMIADALAPAAPPARAVKPLPVPIEKPRNKRGGRRARKAKELYGMSEIRKRENRMGFGAVAAGDYGEKELGMAETGHGRIRRVKPK